MENEVNSFLGGRARGGGGGGLGGVYVSILPLGEKKWNGFIPI